MADESQNIFFRPEELPFFDEINAEAQRLTAHRAKYYLKILPPTTQDESRFEKETLYGEQKRNWKFAGPLTVPIYVETPAEPKEYEENRGGSKDINASAIISRKLFEESIPEDLAASVIAARGALIPDAGDIIAMWTTHMGDVAFWDVESLERDAYLGDLPLHLQWRMVLIRRTRYAAERAFGLDFEAKEPIVIITPDEFDRVTRPYSIRPETLGQGKLIQDSIEKRALGM
jgi:hypothetical protein